MKTPIICKLLGRKAIKKKRKKKKERVYCKGVPPAGDSVSCTVIDSESLAHSAQPCNLIQMLERGLLPPTHYS